MSHADSPQQNHRFCDVSAGHAGHSKAQLTDHSLLAGHSEPNPSLSTLRSSPDVATFQGSQGRNLRVRYCVPRTPETHTGE